MSTFRELAKVEPDYIREALGDLDDAECQALGDALSAGEPTRAIGVIVAKLAPYLAAYREDCDDRDRAAAADYAGERG